MKRGQPELSTFSVQSCACRGEIDAYCRNCLDVAPAVRCLGNRTAQTGTGGTCNPFSAAATTHNQLVGYTYDSAGNLTNDGSHRYTYDVREPDHPGRRRQYRELCL